MMRLISACAALALAAPPAFAQLRAELVVAGLSQPVAFVQDPTRQDVRFVVEQGGRIRATQAGALLPTDFLDLSSQVLFAGEQGLLGLAFAPDYAASGRFFVNFVNRAGNTVIARFKRSATDPLIADPGSRFDLVWPDGNAYITQPFANHKGGDLKFGPDGYLYIGMGDGGAGDDPGNRAQDPQTLLGKFLRIDVAVPDGDPRGYTVPAGNPFVGQPGVLPEIWAFGVRNPWRFSFDDGSRGGTGALVIADVGQGAWEEIDYEPRGQGGRNYGWRNREGAHDHIMTLPPSSTPLTDPIFEYPHTVGQSITGGFVYRGAALGASYYGRYFFADFVAGRIWSMGLRVDPTTGEAIAGGTVEHTGELGAAAVQPSTFGVDARGELYVVSYGAGAVYRIDSAANVCATPDPFVVLGGGVCINGGWLPPDMPVPGVPPPAPPPVTIGCVTPDPFVVLGGGNCVNGGWLPPDMPVPGVPPPAPPPAPPPVTGGCVTPDPFVVMGGGNCVNGGWLPPDMPVPAAPPRPAAGGCVTPDPFISIPGLIGNCINGGWLPVPGVSTTGTVRFFTMEGGFWAIQADDGTIYDPIGGVPPDFRADGLRVSFAGKLRSDLVGFHMVGPIIEIVQISVL